MLDDYINCVIPAIFQSAYVNEILTFLSAAACNAANFYRYLVLKYSVSGLLYENKFVKAHNFLLTCFVSIN